MEMTAKRKKVLCPVERPGTNGKPKQTYWVRVGTAFVNRDGSTNIYLDATPQNGKLQVRDLDEHDLKPRAERSPEAVETAVPF